MTLQQLMDALGAIHTGLEEQGEAFDPNIVKVVMRESSGDEFDVERVHLEVQHSPECKSIAVIIA